MEEAILDSALETCSKLHSSLAETLEMVSDMNVRYNENCPTKNWRVYIKELIDKYKMPQNEFSKLPALLDRSVQSDDAELNSPSKDQQKKSEIDPLTPRSSHELIGLNTVLNYRFIKIKRNLESAIASVRRTIRIAERQPDYTQMDLNWRSKKFDFVH